MENRFSLPALLEDETLPTPLRLTPESIDKLKVDIQGYTFLLIGQVLVCPECGKISGVKAVKDLDEELNFFLAFGCEHYKNDKKLSVEEEVTVNSTPPLNETVA